MVFFYVYCPLNVYIQGWFLSDRKRRLLTNYCTKNNLNHVLFPELKQTHHCKNCVWRDSLFLF